jgi:putative ABC transport system ATP-binding protein
MHILGCLDKPTGGHYRLDDIDMVNLDDDALSHLRNHKIGFVFQQFHLLDRSTALRNVMLPLIYADEYPEDARGQAEKALAAVGLADRMTYRPNQLSGGQQQRVAIARALITDPSIILADEPTGNLDSKSGAEVMAIFQRLHQDGRTIIVVSHDRAVAEHAHRIIVLKDGTVAEDQPVAHPRDAEAEAVALAEKEVTQ